MTAQRIAELRSAAPADDLQGDRALGPVRRLWALSGHSRPRMAAGVALAAAATGASVALLAVSAWLIMRASFEPPVLHLMVAVTGVRFFGISRGVFRYAERLVSHEAAFDALGRVRLALYAKLERLAPHGGLWRRGDLLERLIADVDALANLITRAVLPLSAAVTVFAASLLTAALIHPASAAVLALALLVAVVVGPLLVDRGDRREEYELRAVRARRAAVVSESVLAAGDPGLAAISDRWLDELDEIDAAEARLSDRSARRAGIAAMLAMLALAAAAVVILLMTVDAVRTGALAAENAAVLTILPLALLELAQSVQPAVAQVASTRASARRVMEVLDADEPERHRGRASLPAPAWPITLRDAAVQWPGSRSPAARGIDLTLCAGSRVAVVGRSGSGKSTLLAALMGYADVSVDSYQIGGRPAVGLDPERLRGLFAWSDQTAHLFDTTIEENIRLARPDATDADLADVLERAQLTSWVAGLPRGVRTRVGQFGVLVSGGQRQRIALARALLADRPVLLIDEPTAGLDRETGRALIADILAGAGERAVLLVTHETEDAERFSQVLDLDRLPR